jgi:hypothetical protein
LLGLSPTILCDEDNELVPKDPIERETKICDTGVDDSVNRSEIICSSDYQRRTSMKVHPLSIKFFHIFCSISKAIIFVSLPTV